MDGKRCARATTGGWTTRILGVAETDQDQDQEHEHEQERGRRHEFGLVIELGTIYQFTPEEVR
ncbi:MAG: hypothetical protein QOI34_28 [Verrucomicrobiota bacterium]